MQLTAKPKQSVWFSTEPVFGVLTPQPEVEIRPMLRHEKIELIQECTNVVMVPHPDKPNQFLQAERFDKFRFAQEALYHCIVGFKHFERADGQPLQATPEDIDYLLETLDQQGNAFENWLQECVKSVSGTAEKETEEARKNFSRGREPIASPKARR